MVQPTHHPAVSHAIQDIQLKAATTDTLQYLATRVGELVEAKVVKVTHQLVNDKATRESQLSVQPQAKQAMDLSARSKDTVKQSSLELNPNRYEVLMNVGGNKTLSVQSPLAPRIGQILQLQVLSSQQVEITGLRTGSISEAISSSPIHNSNPLAASSQALRNPETLANSQQAKNRAESIAILHSALRDNLPKQVAKESLANHLEALTRQQAALTSTANLSSPLQLATKQLQKSINTLQSVTQPDGLANALRNSGLLYEAKLAQLINTARTNGLALANPAINALAQKLGITLASNPATELAANINTANNQVGSSDKPVLTNNIDHKQAALQLITALKSSLLSKDIASNKVSNPALKDNATLASLWALVANSANNNNTLGLRSSASDNDDQLLQLLRLALSVVTRTQSQQLFNANTQLFSHADNVNNPSWSLELPVWVEQKLNLIDIQIASDQNNKQLAADEEKAWNARLTFDLEQHGSMVAFASLRGKTIAAVLWVTEAATVKRVNAELALMAQNLDRLGLQVERLQCRIGEPEDIRPNGTINLLDTEV